MLGVVVPAEPVKDGESEREEHDLGSFTERTCSP